MTPTPAQLERDVERMAADQAEWNDKVAYLRYGFVATAVVALAWLGYKAGPVLVAAVGAL